MSLSELVMMRTSVLRVTVSEACFSVHMLSFRCADRVGMCECTVVSDLIFADFQRSTVLFLFIRQLRLLCLNVRGCLDSLLFSLRGASQCVMIRPV